jgi:L-ascorbate metabolism protein UlaG (beta-lactamase superfamily)
MQVQWYGQSAFRLTDGGTTVFVDPFGDMSALTKTRGIKFDYPAIDGVSADLLLVTHEHRDHNAVDAIGGDPVVIRSTAGRHESPIGEIVGVASEHDTKAGTERGPNTIFVFDFGGARVAHFGDFGQTVLRDEQAEAVGQVDLAFIPVGSGPTIGAQQAVAVADRIGARWIVPMHYRTPRIGFLEPADEFLELVGAAERFDSPSFDTAELPASGRLAAVPAVP